MSLGERIVELRKLCGLNQNQLAKLMEVSRQAVSKWETGQSAPDALNMIRLAEILETDVEYLTTGRRSYGRRPPVVINTVETVEKLVEKPVIQVVEKIVEKKVEIHVVEYVEKPVIKKVYYKKNVRNPLEFIVVGLVCFIVGIIFGLLC
jgi:transcriptional regulator with XRE-family HTH domain